jgi:hypothetical protein
MRLMKREETVLYSIEHSIQDIRSRYWEHLCVPVNCKVKLLFWKQMILVSQGYQLYLARSQSRIDSMTSYKRRYIKSVSTFWCYIEDLLTKRNLESLTLTRGVFP